MTLILARTAWGGTNKKSTPPKSENPPKSGEKPAKDGENKKAKKLGISFQGIGSQGEILENARKFGGLDRGLEIEGPENGLPRTISHAKSELRASLPKTASLISVLSLVALVVDSV